MKSKKIFLSSFVVLAFVAYAISLRLKGDFFQRLLLDDDDVRIPFRTSAILDTTTQPAAQIPANQNSGSNMMPATMGSSMQKSPMMGLYKDGTYTGTSVDVYYGYVQVATVIQGGKIVDIKFLDYPKDRSTSLEIASYSLPILKTEAISVQNANVDVVSGATETSKGFRESLASALAQAK
jgi:uncharacterized protein with FMN-binding domain